MNSFRERLLTWFTSVKKGFGQLSEIQLILLFTGVGAVLLTFWGIASLWKEEDPYELAFRKLTPDDQTGILAYFSQHQIVDYKLEGDSLFLPSSRLPEMRMKLAEQGLPARGSGLGWERFQQSNLLMTDFEQRMQKILAIQGELSRTINQLEPVLGSRVHLVLPEASVFLQDERQPRASIYVKLRPQEKLSRSQISGIQHLVAQAVERLELNQVVIIDQTGNILTKNEDDSFEQLSSAQVAYQKNLEGDLEEKIQSILSRVVGVGKIISRVKADVDFSEKEMKSESVDPDRTAVVSSNRKKQSAQGSGLNPTGVPGAKSNVPGEREDLDTTPGLLQSQNENSEILNYEVSKSWSTRKEQVGGLQKLSVAVLVDGQMVDGAYQPRTEEEMQKIEQLVKNAIGFSSTRGDQLTVQNVQFTADPIEAGLLAAQKKAEKDALMKWIFWAIGLVLFSLGLLFLLRPYLKWLMQNPEKVVPARFPVEAEDHLWKRVEGGRNLMKIDSKMEDFDTLDHLSKVIFLSQKEPVRAATALKKVISGE